MTPDRSAPAPDPADPRALVATVLERLAGAGALDAATKAEILAAYARAQPLARPLRRRRASEAEALETLFALLTKPGPGAGETASITPTAWAEAVAAVLDQPRLDPRRLETPIDPALSEDLSALSPRFLETIVAPPVALDANGTLIAAHSAPGDDWPVEALRIALGRPVCAQIATPDEADRARARMRPQKPAIAIDPEQLRADAEAGPIVGAVADLILRAAAAGASDLHLEPTETELTARMRVDGALRPLRCELKDRADAAVSRVKLVAGLDIAERRKPQDGRVSAAAFGGAAAALDRLDLRVATAPALHGETVALRLLRRAGPPPRLDALGAAPAVLAAIERALEKPAGLILATGPTVAGKTTTLYAMLARLNAPERKIVTIEDPIEYRIDGLTQIQAQPSIGVDFARALRATLRHDPDVAMVGEIRDAETAQTAAQAALTGHLVLSTAHANDAAGAAARLIDLGAPPPLVGAVLSLCLAQRLAPRLCPDCRRAESPGDWRAPGCAACDGSGLRGRVGLFEAVEIDAELSEIIAAGGSAAAIRAAARARGAASLGAAAADFADRGEIARAEADRLRGLDP